jgi:hypothetical protein
MAVFQWKLLHSMSLLEDSMKLDAGRHGFPFTELLSAISKKNFILIYAKYGKLQ